MSPTPAQISLQMAHQLRCIGCGAAIRGSEVAEDFRCRSCGSLFDVEYPDLSGRAVVSEESIASRYSGSAVNWKKSWAERRLSNDPLDRSGVWRFRELLPFMEDERNVVTLQEGNTPLYRLSRAAERLGLEKLFAKHQGMNPTGSFKDTGMTAALSVARERGFHWVACASTGNTSAAMAAYAARAGMRALVLIPESKVAWGKLAQSLDYGAITCQLKTDFDGCVAVLGELVRRAPVYLLNSVNPYRLEGQKTPAMEIAEAMDWEAPDHIIVPGGNLANGAALGKGFAELRGLGLTDRRPRVSVIQAEGANPLYQSIMKHGGKEIHPVRAETRATAIRIGNPASWQKAARVLRETGGWCEQVSEQEIALAKAEIGLEGIGCEPASAATLAGLKKLVADKHVQSHETIVLVLTGHTLKDPEYTIDLHRGSLLTPEEKNVMPKAQLRELEILTRAPVVLDPTVEAVLRVLDRAGRA
ncbi:MAG: threonine synthase [Acidobacteriaceae bacterium]